MILLRSTIIFLILPVLVWQSSQDAIRQHYEAAESARLAGNLVAAETEYTAILAEGYQRLGEIYLVQEDPKNAIGALQSAIEYRPKSSALLLQLAIAYFDSAQYDKAIEVAQKVLTFEPQNGGAHQMLGKSYFMLGSLVKAVSELEVAAKLNPNDIDVIYTLGIAYLRNRQNDAAKRTYESMVKQFGDQAQLHVIIGRAYRQSGLLSDAADEFKNALAIDPRCPRAHYYLGITYLLDEGQSRINDALDQFKLEVALNPDEFLANYYLGVVYVFQRQWEPAIEALQKASAIDPNNPDPYFQLGQAYQELNQHERAVEVLRKAIAYNPDLGHNKGQVTTAHHRLAQSLLKLGQTEAGRKELQIASDLKAEAFKLEQQTAGAAPGMSVNSIRGDDTNSSDVNLRKPLASGPTGQDASKTEQLNNDTAYYKKVVATAHNNLGLLRAERQDFIVAAGHFAQAIKWNPEQEGLAFNLGLAYYKSQSFEAAVPALEQELKSHPGNRAARALLGLSCFMAELYPRAAELLRELVEPGTDDVNVMYAFGAATIRQGRPNDAQPLIERMKTIAVAAPQLHLLLAETHLSRREFNEALSELNLAISVGGDSKLVHYYAGMIYAIANKSDEAVREFERELVLNPNDSQTKYQLARILVNGKNADRGLLLMREVVAARPESYAAHYALGQALVRRREFQAALQNLEIAVRLRPDNAEAHYQLGQAYIGAGRQIEGNEQISISKALKNKAPNATIKN